MSFAYAQSSFYCCFSMFNGQQCLICAMNPGQFENCLDNNEQFPNDQKQGLYCGGSDPGVTISLPDMSMLTGLEYLQLDFLVGEIHDSIFSLSNLKSLQMRSNYKWSSTLPEDVTRLSQLQKLSFAGSYNLYGPIPTSYGPGLPNCGDNSIDLSDLNSVCLLQDSSASEIRPKLIGDVSNCPTASPTRFPTSSPTKSPSKSPTRSPTTSPTTAEPTTSPTARPTTSSPTNSPTTPGPTWAPTTTEQRVAGVYPYCGETLVEPMEMTGAFYAETASMVVGTVMALAGALYIFVYREKPVFAGSLPWLMISLCLALVLCNVAVWLYSYGIFNPSDALCGANSWVTFISFTTVVIILGYLLLHQGLHQRTNYAIIGCITFVVVVLLATWTAASPPKANACSQYICSSASRETTAPYMFALVFVLFLVVVVQLIGVIHWKDSLLTLSMGFDGAVGSTVALAITCVLWLLVHYLLIEKDKADIGYLILGLTWTVVTSIIVFFLTIRKHKLLSMTQAEHSLLFQEARRRSVIAKAKSVGEPNFTPYKTYTTSPCDVETPEDDEERAEKVGDAKPSQDTVVPTNEDSGQDQVPPPLPPKPLMYRKLTKDYPCLDTSQPATAPAFLPPGHAFVNDLDDSSCASDSSMHNVVQIDTGNEGNVQYWQDNGFKVGVEGDWNCYIHRQTGDPFWINPKTDQIRFEEH